ncbi:hypothetical protein GCM10011607_11950 [Shewanella inventionis]|uniref:Uncharacterized protein n=1 Tax=Shewanella inventionis TaxID=1738770 RepID=A0ABQ1IVC2_9GAMM|nr:hypothetical protein [Shewanella inventionis]GGB53049.1 hypothetical protein GCM10011607_11950 [Shewanella inventionis]
MTLEAKIGTIFNDYQSDSRALWKALLRNSREMKKEYGELAVDEALADYYLFFADDECKLLRNFLLNKYEAVNSGVTLKNLVLQYEADGFLVMEVSDNYYKVIAPSQKSNREDCPFQVSYWRLGDKSGGVSGDAGYQTLEKAISEESLLCEKPITDPDRLSYLENEFVKAESVYQENYRHHMNSYNLN